jgi:hypothetical protein
MSGTRGNEAAVQQAAAIQQAVREAVQEVMTVLLNFKSANVCEQ